MIDMADVAFMDSSGLTVLVAAKHAGLRVSIVYPSAIVRRILELAGMADLIDDSTSGLWQTNIDA
jgi:anti-anti-sigma factor